MLSAAAAVLMFFSFHVPFTPSFLKMDLSELPALLAAYAFGPVSGIAVCFVKNLVNLPFTTTGGVGELANFLLGAAFVLPAGLTYSCRKTRGGAFLGAILGAVFMAACSLPVNYYIVYPVYTAFLPMNVILDMYAAIIPSIRTLFDALLTINVPFTFVKAMLSVGIAFLIYKPLAPILKGKR